MVHAKLMRAEYRSIQVHDTPDAAKRPTTARTVFTAPVYKGDIFFFIDKINQEFHYEYVIKGHRLIHNNTIITIFQIFKVPL
jgi:Med18 protein